MVHMPVEKHFALAPRRPRFRFSVELPETPTQRKGRHIPPFGLMDHPWVDTAAPPTELMASAFDSRLPPSPGSGNYPMDTPARRT